MSSLRCVFLFLILALVFIVLPTDAQTWTIQNSGTSVYLYGAAYVNANNAYVVGGDMFSNRTIRKSTNGGVNWTNQSTPNNTLYYAVNFYGTDI